MESVDNYLVDSIRDSITLAEKKEVDCADAQGSG
ncbi:MAG: hypothetical protein A4E54_00759 [Pelotomaculum sp. PtaB.Bin117]|nr:MAG: hypothetical protein A4E54_00759 [Pelotomaculum sp. PtaB.Bin117]